MAFYKQDIVDINLNTGNIHRSFLSHAIGYKNDDADRFGIRTFRDGVPQDLTGASCQAVFMAPNGSKIALTSYGTVSGNVAYVTLPPACYDYEGQFCLAIQLVGGGVTGTMRIVDGMVVNTGASGTVAPTSAVPTYQEIIAQYDAMVAATAAANGAIAATYSGSATYKVGDYCIHDGGLYRCITAITTAEAWNAAHWTATKIGPDVSDLKSAFNNTENDIFSYESVNLSDYSTVNAFMDGNKKWQIDGNNYASYLIPLKNIFRITVIATSEYNSTIAFLHSIDNIIDEASADVSQVNNERISVTSGTTAVYEVPKDAKYLYVAHDIGSSRIRDPKALYLSAINEQMIKECATYDDYIFTSGTINAIGGYEDNIKRIRTTVQSSPIIMPGDVIYSDGVYDFQVKLYTKPIQGETYFVGTLKEEWKDKRVFSIPETYSGEIAALLIRKVGHENDDISADVSTVGNHIKYIRSAKTKNNLIIDSVQETANIIKLAEKKYIGCGVNDNGGIESNDNYTAVEIPISGGKTIEAKGCRKSAFYDASHTLISGSVVNLNYQWKKNGFAIYTVPETAKYIRTSYLTSEENDVAIYYVNPIDGIGKFIRDFYYKNKFVLTGDSVSAGSKLQTYTDAYPYLIANDYNMNFVNFSIGGSSIAKLDGSYDEILFAKSDLATADTSKTYLVKDEPTDDHPFALYHYINGNWEMVHPNDRSAANNGRSPMVDRVIEMQQDADLIMIMGGANDFMYHFTPFGSMADRTKYTFYGAMHVLCQYLVETYVNKQIIFVGALNRYQVVGQGTADWDCDSPDAVCPTTGKTLRDYMNAEKEVCAYYSIPFIDIQSISGFCPPFEHSMYADDNGSYIHPNTAGHKRLASVIEAQMKTYRV